MLNCWAGKWNGVNTMIAYLKGIIVEVTESRLILDVNDIGYLNYIS